MTEKNCNLWLERADYRCVLTSGAVGPDGAAVIDTVSATTAAKKFAGFATDLGRLLQARGTHVHQVRDDLLAFPIKRFKWEKPNAAIIKQSATELLAIVGEKVTLLPKPDGIPWDDVKAALADLPDTVVVCPES